MRCAYKMVKIASGTQESVHTWFTGVGLHSFQECLIKKILPVPKTKNKLNKITWLLNFNFPPEKLLDDCTYCILCLIAFCKTPSLVLVAVLVKESLWMQGRAVERAQLVMWLVKHSRGWDFCKSLFHNKTCFSWTFSLSTNKLFS